MQSIQIKTSERSKIASCANYIANQVAEYPIEYPGAGPTIDQDAKDARLKLN